MRILFLYEELAWYFVNCLNTLADSYNVDVHVICKKPNAVAPFAYNYISPRVKMEYREGKSQEELYAVYTSFAPDLLYLGGWACDEYIRLLKQAKHPNAVIGFDNQWSGSLKQRLGTTYFRTTLKPLFHAAFVPGKRQKEFAKRIGFSDENIALMAYCGDYELFHKSYEADRDEKQKAFPRVLLYVGRYAPEKGIEELWQAFIDVNAKTEPQWELWCLGSGPIQPVKHPQIRHFGFVQPDAMAEIIRQSGVFVLPSTFEPWGVVAHEYAAAGLPMILSDAVGASDVFLRNNENGFLFPAGDTNALSAALKKMMSLSDTELNEMAQKSAELGSEITPQKWSESLLSLIKQT